MDFYPYCGGSTTLVSLLPPSVMEGSVEATLKKLGTPRLGQYGNCHWVGADSFKLSDQGRKPQICRNEFPGGCGYRSQTSVFHADINLFDPAKVRDYAVYENPKQLSAGFHMILVDGAAAVSDDAMVRGNCGGVIKL